jgi:hypothetical protein
MHSERQKDTKTTVPQTHILSDNVVVRQETAKEDQEDKKTTNNAPQTHILSDNVGVRQETAKEERAADELSAADNVRDLTS